MGLPSRSELAGNASYPCAITGGLIIENELSIFSKIKADKSARKPHKHAELHGFKQWFVGQQELTFRNSQPKLENQAV